MELSEHDRQLAAAHITLLADGVESAAGTMDMEEPARRFFVALVATRLLLRSSAQPEAALHHLLENYRGLIDEEGLS